MVCKPLYITHRNISNNNNLFPLNCLIFEEESPNSLEISERLDPKTKMSLPITPNFFVAEVVKNNKRSPKAF